MTRHAPRNPHAFLISLSTVILLVALSTASFAQLASGPWPMFRHDMSHSGVSPYHDPTPSGTPWSRSIGNGLSSPVIASDGTIYIGGSGALYALNSDGTVKWSAAINSSTRSTPAIGSDGTIYIGSGTSSAQGRLYAFNPTGTQKWYFSVGSNCEMTSSPAIGPDGTVYIGARNGYLYAVTPGASSGTQKWRYNTGDMHMTSPVVSADGSTVYTAGGANIWAFNAADGTKKWNYTTGVSTTSSAALSPDGSTIYVGAYDGNLYAIDAASGALVWNVQVGFKNAATCSSPAVGPDGTIYIGSNYGSLYAIYPNGTQKWIFETKADLASDRDIRSSVAINADGTVYVATYNGYVYALDSATGLEKWHFLTTGTNYASPAIAADGSVVTAAMNGYVFGNLTGTPPTATPPSGLMLSLASSTSVRLDWADNSSDEYGFRIERRVGTTGDYTYLAKVGAGVTTYTNSGLQSGMTYYYRVCAYQSGGQSAYTNAESIDTPGLMTPVSLVATPIAGHQVDLTWTDRASDELGFKIERSEGPNGLFREVACVGADVTTYSDHSVYPATNYYYRVRAFDATRDSSYSNEDWALTPGKDFSDITIGDTSRKQIALTFDAGTAAIRTGLLSTLKANSVFCTMFITGYVTEVQSANVNQIGKDGHHIGNHSYDHPDLRYCTDEQIAWQLGTTDGIIRTASGHHTQSFFRAPYGACNEHVIDAAAAVGFRHVEWTTDTGDANGASTQQIINAATNGAKNGAIILCHCTVANTEAAVPTIITNLRNAGYELVTIPELVAPTQVTSPEGCLSRGWNLVSVPIEPALPFPHIVFRGLSISNALYRCDSTSRNDFVYDAVNPAAFGNISVDQSYWVYLDAPATIKVNGSPVTEDRHIPLATPIDGRYATTLVGYPFDTPQPFYNCKVYNPNAPDPKTRPVPEAIEAGWIPPVMYTMDNATQMQLMVGEPGCFESDLQPWHGYMMWAWEPGVELIIPVPEEPSVM